jgi:hypothetical protein
MFGFWEEERERVEQFVQRDDTRHAVELPFFETQCKPPLAVRGKLRFEESFAAPVRADILERESGFC